MSFLQPLYDCELLMKVFDASTGQWTTEQKDAVAAYELVYAALGA